MRQSTLKYGFTVLLMASLAWGCSSTTETIVIRDQPRTVSAQPDTTIPTALFNQLNIGLIDSVTNFDPLFISNLSSQRVIRLIYEGLFTVNREGEPIPQLIKEYTVSEDGLTYTIELHNNRFYHDSDAFSTGIGRRLNAMDVKRSIMRSAKMTVPVTASHLFMNIRGYEPYFKEHRLEFDPAMRKLRDVEGIEVTGTFTLRIRLLAPDPDFKLKLASPFAVIYPHEALRNDEMGLFRRPVGTAAYRLNRVERPGYIILSRHQNYSPDLSEAAPFNRIDIYTITNESELFQKFARQELDLIPEIGVQTVQSVTDSTGSIIPAYADRYRLYQGNGSREITVYLNTESDYDLFPVKNLWDETLPDRHFKVPGLQVNLNTFQPDTSEGSDPIEFYLTSFTQDYLSRNLLNTVSTQLFQPAESSVRFMELSVPNRNAAFYTNSSDSWHSGFITLSDHGFSLAEASFSQWAISHRYVSGYSTNDVPWWIPVTTIRINEQLRNQ
jgi:ABC-type transport system substrate-binding protein